MANGHGTCIYYWNGQEWQGPQVGCYPNCHCSGEPPIPPPGTPPFFEAVPCVPNSGPMKAAKPVVRLHVSENVELHVVHVARKAPAKKRPPKRGAKKKS